MSPFGRKKDDEGQSQTDGQPTDSNPQLDAEVARLQGLSPTQLAAEVMAKGFSAQYDPTDDGREVPEIADEFFPRPDWSVRDSTVKAQVREAQEEKTPGSPQQQLLVLADLVAEGVQTLEHASLVGLKTNYDGQYFNAGYTATRLGRQALERNAVDQVLAKGTL